MMRILFPIFLAASIVVAAAVPVVAASSDWETVEGGRVRLVVADALAADGTLRGALEIQLSPGWKTYWRDPGDSGVPPSLTASPDSGYAVELAGYPPPEWFDEDGSAFAGYKHSVALPVRMTPAGQDGRVRAEAFLGICKAICIPVQARFDIALGASGSSSDDRLVGESFDALPATPTAEFGVASAKAAGDELVVEIQAPDPESAELFLASDGRYVFGRPHRESTDEPFTVKLVATPKQPGKPAEIPYTLVSGGKAVAGTIPLP